VLRATASRQRAGRLTRVVPPSVPQAQPAPRLPSGRYRVPPGRSTTPVGGSTPGSQAVSRRGGRDACSFASLSGDRPGHRDVSWS